MKNSLLFAVLLYISIFVSTSITRAQPVGEVGKLYTKTEVEKLFGNIVKSVSISSVELTKLANETPDYIMFNILDGHLFILNSSRKVLMGPASSVKSDQVFRLLSTHKVIELLTMGGSDITNIEIREKALTLTNGLAALEEAFPCPPICHPTSDYSEIQRPKEIGKLYTKAEAKKH
jgi:hypothetical protein